MLLVVGNLIYTPFKALPLELQVFALAEFIPRIIFDFDFLAAAILILGLILIPLKWRKGKISLGMDKIKIEGSVAIALLIERLRDVDVFDANHGVKRTVHLTSDTDKIKLKFRNKVDFESFSTRLVELAGQSENVNLKTWTD